jgi:hypothetical protein
MKFGKYLLAMRIQGWEEYYVDYKTLQRYVVCEQYIGGRSTTSIIRHYKGMWYVSDVSVGGVLRRL